MASGLFGDQKTHLKALVEKIIYSKTLEWEHESEYRFVVPVGRDEEPWNTLPYRPEEITELYLGAKITNEDSNDIVSKAVAVNPEIAIFEGKRSDQGQIDFENFN